MKWINIKDKLPKDDQKVLWLVNCDEDSPVICQGSIDTITSDEESIFWITLPKIIIRFDDANIILHSSIFEPFEPLSQITHWANFPDYPT